MWLRGLAASGFDFHLHYLWLPSADAAVERVKQRAEAGGHFVPDETVRRRYSRGLQNFFRLYRALATGWGFYDSSTEVGPALIARGEYEMDLEVADTKTSAKLLKEYRDE